MSNKKQQLSIIMLLTTTKTTSSEEVNRFKKILIVLTFFYSVQPAPGNTSCNNAAGACLPSGSSRTEQNSSCSSQAGNIFTFCNSNERWRKMFLLAHGLRATNLSHHAWLGLEDLLLGHLFGRYNSE